MVPSHARLATRVAVLSADGERRTNPFVARRLRLVPIELRIDAAPNRFGQRNTKTRGVACQSPVLTFGHLYLRTHHDVMNITSLWYGEPKPGRESGAFSWEGPLVSTELDFELDVERALSYGTLPMALVDDDPLD